MMGITIGSLLALALSGASIAQNTCTGAAPERDPTVVANGFTAYILARGLSSPRGIVFDKEGNLLVIEKSKGVTALKLKEDGNCVSVASKTAVVTNSTVSLEPILKS
jgi:glucose/arabinose dehydrogenase